MPIYAFECAACGHDFDRLQKLSDADPTDCPVCAKPELRRQLTAPQFRLSGSGWYETDFKKDGEKKHHLADGGKAPTPAPEKAATGEPASTAAPAAAAAPSKAAASDAAS
ncbi:MAG: zinc ribbon domain-containing protein [Rhodanobacter sp.]